MGILPHVAPSGGELVFQGEFDHSVDDKGRVIIPTKFRQPLGLQFYMTKGVGGCVFVYTTRDYEDMSNKLAEQRPLDPDTLRLQRFFTATDVQIDNQGRVGIPSKLRDWAKIDLLSDVVVLGTGNRIEIWNSVAWNTYNDQLTDAMITESAREVGIA